MDQEASLLEIVRRKEIELKSKTENAAKEAEEAIAKARRRAEEIIESAKRKGEEESARYIEEQQAALEREIQEIKEKSLYERNRISSIAAGRIDEAVELIISRIAAKGP